MLEPRIREQLVPLFAGLAQPVEFVTAFDDSLAAHRMREILEELAQLAPQLAVVCGGEGELRRPSFTVRRAGGGMSVSFATVPQGAQFTSLVLAILQAGGRTGKLEPGEAARIAALEGDYLFETYISFSCHNCADLVQMLVAMAAVNPRIRQVVVDGHLFPDEVARRDVRGVPMLFLNGAHFGQGRITLGDLLGRLEA